MTGLPVRVRCSIAWPSATTSCAPTTSAWWQQLEVTGIGRARRGDAAARRRLRHRPARDRGSRALRRARVGRRQLEGDDRPGSRPGRASGVAFRVATADALPFRERMVRRSRRCASWCTRSARLDATAFHEAARVLTPRGRLYIWTFARAHFTGFYLAPYLPSLPAVDLARFPDPDELPAELRAAGFVDIAEQTLVQAGLISRAEAAVRVRAGYISTVHLLPSGRGCCGSRSSRGRGERGRTGPRDAARLAPDRRNARRLA